MYERVMSIYIKVPNSFKLNEKCFAIGTLKLSSKIKDLTMD